MTRNVQTWIIGFALLATSTSLSIAQSPEPPGVTTDAQRESRQEAKAYLEHPILGPRIRECTRLVNLVEGRSISEIFDQPDDLKFRSSMTLFAAVAPDDQFFKDALQKYFGGEPDPSTLELL